MVLEQRLPSSEAGRFSGIVRSLQETDLPQLRPILETWMRDSKTHELEREEVEETLKRMQESLTGDNDRKYFVAEETDGRIIGVIGMIRPGEVMQQFATTNNPIELVNAFVAMDKRRGQGVGRALVAALETEAKRRGITEIVLNSGSRYEEFGWGFYDRLEGYSRVGVAKNLYGPGFDAQVWRKIL